MNSNVNPTNLIHRHRSWKRKARRCIVHSPDHRIRWMKQVKQVGRFNPYANDNKQEGHIQVCTDTSTDSWVDFKFCELCDLLIGCTERAGKCSVFSCYLKQFDSFPETIIKEFGQTVYTFEELAELKDPEDVTIGCGMMEINNPVKISEVILPFPPEEVLAKCFECGNR